MAAKGSGGSTAPASRTFSARAFSWLLRSIFWFSVITILFRCPDSPASLTADSPRLCAPYFSLRSRLKPHLQPYYDSYAAPYVEVVQPYANGFHQHVYLPVSALARDNYVKYAAPGVHHAAVVAEQQWDHIVRPRVNQARKEAQAQYATLLQPYVSRASDVLYPPLQYARIFALHQYRNTLIPSYHFSRPYISSTYSHGRRYLIDVGFPYAVWLSKGTASFVHTRVWPPLRIVYGQNVEPQLAKIRQRLSSYRDGKRMEAVVEEVDQSVPADTDFTSSAVKSFETVDPVESVDPLESVESVESVEPMETPESQPEASPPQEPITSPPDSQLSTNTPQPTVEPQTNNGGHSKLINDLKKWQLKFDRASEQGAEDLSLRVADLTARQVQSQVNGVGEALVTQLEDESSRQLAGLKSTIVRVVESLLEDASEADQQDAYSTIRSTIRSAGGAIKERAQELRLWKLKYSREMEYLIRDASDSTLDVMDSIRDLGLQEIGLRWASMEDVSYQDWAAYHSMKKTFDDWRVRVAAVAQDHEGLATARKLGNELEDRGMSIAQDAAAELGRLKTVAKWKINAHDTSDDFSTHELSASAARLGQKFKEALTSAKDYVQSAASSVQGTAESAVSDMAAEASSLTTQASEAIGSSMSEAASEAASVAESVQVSAQSMASDMAAEASSLTTDASSVIASSISEASSDAASVADSVTQEAGTIPKHFGSQVSEGIREQATLIPSNEDMSGRVSSMVESIVVQAGRPAGTKASSILSAMVSSAEEAKTSVLSAGESISSEFPEYIADTTARLKSAKEAAQSVIELGWESISEQVPLTENIVASVIDDYSSSASEAFQRASATIGSSVDSASDDIIDKASSRSEEFLETVLSTGQETSEELPTGDPDDDFLESLEPEENQL